MILGSGVAVPAHGGRRGETAAPRPLPGRRPVPDPWSRKLVFEAERRGLPQRGHEVDVSMSRGLVLFRLYSTRHMAVMLYKNGVFQVYLKAT